MEQMTGRKVSMIEKGKTDAIITEYHDSSNYGGNLQVYALTRYLNENGICALSASSFS